MKINYAEYGGKDVTEIISSKISNDSLLLKVNNDFAGDPAVGVKKWLKIDYEIDGKTLHDEWSEGNICTLPKSVHNRLGIFYSNNHNNKIFPTIEKSLKSIQKAAENKADILTCMWFPFQNNPFNEIISWYQSSSHLNQILQILQLLYTAKEMGKYDYVSFLEHDCLYGEGYFDYDEFEEGTIIANMNYIGVNQSGWQQKRQNDKPTSQLTMRFNDAIKHFEKILPNALVTNSGLLEPQIQIKEWNAPNSSVHVNHGFHFTSHFSIYGEGEKGIHLYWGKHTDYLLPQ
jgi:hypothetical protein